MSSKCSTLLVVLIRECAEDHLAGSTGGRVSLTAAMLSSLWENEHADLCKAAATLCVLSCRAQRVPGEQHACRRQFCCAAGESENPQGVVNTSEGRVVRAFHRFTLVDQSGGGRDLTKGRRRDQVGAVC